MRQRDERFANRAHHTDKPDPLHDKGEKNEKSVGVYKASDFVVDAGQSEATCPAGKTLHRNGKHCTIGPYAAVKFRGTQRDCVPCDQRERCLRKPDTTKVRQVAILTRKTDQPISHTERMHRRIDSEQGKVQYARRFATVEPVSAACVTTKGSTASHSVVRRRSIRSGSSTASCTTSRSWPTTAMGDEADAQGVYRLLQAKRPARTTRKTMIGT